MVETKTELKVQLVSELDLLFGKQKHDSKLILMLLHISV